MGPKITEEYNASDLNAYFQMSMGQQNFELFPPSKSQRLTIDSNATRTGTAYFAKNTGAAEEDFAQMFHKGEIFFSVRNLPQAVS